MADVAEYLVGLSEEERGAAMSVEWNHVVSAIDTPAFEAVAGDLNCEEGRRAVRAAARLNVAPGVPADQQLRLVQEEIAATVADLVWTVGAPETYDEMVESLAFQTQSPTEETAAEPPMAYTPYVAADLLEETDMGFGDFRQMLVFDDIHQHTARPVVRMAPKFVSDVGLEYLMRLASPPSAVDAPKPEPVNGMAPAELESVPPPAWAPSADGKVPTQRGVPTCVENVPGFSPESEEARRAYLWRRTLFDTVERELSAAATAPAHELQALLQRFDGLTDAVSLLVCAGTGHITERTQAFTLYLEKEDLGEGSLLPVRDSPAVPSAFVSTETGPAEDECTFEDLLAVSVNGYQHPTKPLLPTYRVKFDQVLKPSKQYTAEELLTLACPGFDPKVGWSTMEPVIARVEAARAAAHANPEGPADQSFGDVALFTAASITFQPYASPANPHVGSSLQFVRSDVMNRVSQSRARLRNQRENVIGDVNLTPLIPSWTALESRLMKSSSRHTESGAPVQEAVKNLPTDPASISTDLRVGVWDATDVAPAAESAESWTAPDGVPATPDCHSYSTDKPVTYEETPEAIYKAIQRGELQSGDLERARLGRRKAPRDHSDLTSRVSKVNQRISWVKKHRSETLAWFDLHEDVAAAIADFQRETVSMLSAISRATRTVLAAHPQVEEDQYDSVLKALKYNLLGALREWTHMCQVSTARWHVRQLLKPYLVTSTDPMVPGRAFVHRSAANAALMRLSFRVMLEKIVKAASGAKAARVADVSPSPTLPSDTETKTESSTAAPPAAVSAAPPAAKPSSDPDSWEVATLKAHPAKASELQKAFLDELMAGLEKSAHRVLSINTLCSIIRRRVRTQAKTRDALAAAMGLPRVTIVGAQFHLPMRDIISLYQSDQRQLSTIINADLQRMTALRDGFVSDPSVVGLVVTSTIDNSIQFIRQPLTPTPRKCFLFPYRTAQVTCSGCKVRHYCSREAQVEHWWASGGHAVRCPLLAAARQKLHILSL